MTLRNLKMKKPTFRELKHEELYDSDDSTDSENEALREALSSGVLKPGLNVLQEEKIIENNKPLIQERYNEIKLDLPWIERLDVKSNLAPMAPELSLQLQDESGLVLDELKRESVFYRQAQAAVLSVLPKLKKLGLITERPDDYLAEMAKSDDHMQKVKAQAIKKKLLMDRVEKIRELRNQKKLQKTLHAQAKVAKVESKREMLDQVKKYRKGETRSLAFLEPGYKKPRQGPSNKSLKKKQYKDSKFGFGGKKRFSKKNTRDSLDGIHRSKGKKLPAKRPGKSVRQKQRSMKK